jgi:hypothetical protein
MIALVRDSKKKTISLSIVEIFLHAYFTSNILIQEEEGVKRLSAPYSAVRDRFCATSEKTIFYLNFMYFFSMKVALC